MGCLKLSYHDQEPAISENWKIFAGGIEKNASAEKKRYDYYPGGSLMPGRKYSSNSYRFGFNGMEKDDEWRGITGADYSLSDFGYDALTNRRKALDPHAVKYPSISPYAAFGNNPLIYIDPDGKDIFIVIKPSSGNTEIKKANHESIVNWMYSSQMGQDMINQYIDNQEANLYISFGDVGENYGYRIRYTKDGEMDKPPHFEIGGNYLYDGDIEEFKYVEINPEKENSFILLNYEKSKPFDFKKGAKVLGHEIGAHVNGDPSKDESGHHDDWGQESLDDIKATGQAKIFNNQINKSMKKSDEIELKELNPRGEYKLKKKSEND